jgi:hypothetical protein
MEQRLKTARQKKAEDEKVRKEELSGAADIKIHDESLRRQEAIAARFETGQEEADHCIRTYLWQYASPLSFLYWTC